jgi:hypothetical protein
LLGWGRCTRHPSGADELHDARRTPDRDIHCATCPRRTASQTAFTAVATLRVKGRAPMTGYDRDQFGQAWLDTNRNGCDTRNDILTRDLTARTTRNCVVESGTLDDPYTGTRIGFVRGNGDLVDIDHVVALGNAWATGAAGWDIRKRAALANDPMNLLAVDAGANRQKGDGDAATWLPSSKRYRCAYVARQVAVKAKYGLWATGPERQAMARVLSGCPGQGLPPDSGAPVRSPVGRTSPPGPRRPVQHRRPMTDRSTTPTVTPYAPLERLRFVEVTPVTDATSTVTATGWPANSRMWTGDHHLSRRRCPAPLASARVPWG